MIKDLFKSNLKKKIEVLIFSNILIKLWYFKCKNANDLNNFKVCFRCQNKWILFAKKFHQMN